MIKFLCFKTIAILPKLLFFKPPRINYETTDKLLRNTEHL